MPIPDFFSTMTPTGMGDPSEKPMAYLGDPRLIRQAELRKPVARGLHRKLQEALSRGVHS